MNAVEAVASPSGWNVYHIDGLNEHLLELCPELKTTDKPNLIIANTIKGKGVSFMENVPKWHYRAPNKIEYLKAIKEINNL